MTINEHFERIGIITSMPESSSAFSIVGKGLEITATFGFDFCTICVFILSLPSPSRQSYACVSSLKIDLQLFQNFQIKLNVIPKASQIKRLPQDSEIFQ